MQLVHEGVLPADDVAGRPPVLPEGMVSLGDEDRPQARLGGRRLRPGAHQQLVQALEVEGERALGAVDLPAHGVLPAGGEAGGLERADGAALELGDRLEGVVDVDAAAGPVVDERPQHARDRLDLADEEAAEVDDVCAEVAERAGACDRPVEPPDLGEGRVEDPVLQVRRAEVVDLAQLAGLDHLAGEADGRDEAVVERAHVLDPGGAHAPVHLEGLVGRPRERLLADHVLAGLGRGDRGLRMERVRAGVVEELHGRVGHEVAPVGRRPLEAVAQGGLGDGVLRPAGDRDEQRAQRRRPRHVRQGAVRVRVRLSHEGVAQHADADGVGQVGGVVRNRFGGVGLEAGHETSALNAWSKTTADGAKSMRRTNASASCAPQFLSMPESSHSTESGPS